jgi:hypothetical protein
MHYCTLHKNLVSCCMCTNLGCQECVLRENGLICMETKNLIKCFISPINIGSIQTAMQLGSLELVYDIY